MGTWQQLGARLALETSSTNDLDLKVSPLVAQAQLDVPQDGGAEHLAAYQLARAEACEYNFQTYSIYFFFALMMLKIKWKPRNIRQLLVKPQPSGDNVSISV